MVPDELALACRLSGLPLGDLWLRYLEMGGNCSRPELEARLGGAGWPQREDRYLAVVADEALRERGLPRLTPPAGAPEPLLGRPTGDDDPVALHQTARAVLETHAHGSRLTALFERCARSREDARGVRERAHAFRQARDAAVLPARGGR
ncbi:hypothetical protein SAMN04488107_2256 [Geodermatophilus saharensis]|uniref:Uncharacterized protein n=1 Tax=Geodermatophilus saharensis TaxID=1137994 RepID=A0A239DP52_9ACTN|nr:hypothetical protein [Geodermatophilus saharensis]SNS33523.1 hypothetical protein SAMN04488107_2256 [Geodermatophilus saharensis]